MRAEDNVRFGTTYLRDLLDRFDDNPVLVSGAYNAGPNAVDRWLTESTGHRSGNLGRDASLFRNARLHSQGVCLRDPLRLAPAAPGHPRLFQDARI